MEERHAAGVPLVGVAVGDAAHQLERVARLNVRLAGGGGGLVVGVAARAGSDVDFSSALQGDNYYIYLYKVTL